MQQISVNINFTIYLPFSCLNFIGFIAYVTAELFTRIKNWLFCKIFYFYNCHVNKSFCHILEMKSIKILSLPNHSGFLCKRFTTEKYFSHVENFERCLKLQNIQKTKFLQCAFFTKMSQLMFRNP